IPLPATYSTAFQEICCSDCNELLVARSGDDIIGCLQVTFIPYLTFKGGRRALLEGVRVATDRRAEGIGRSLVQEAIERARRRHCHMVQLTSDKSRPEAIRFYKALGFEATHEGLKLTIQ
ncbi:MAG: GNAT family N-acetyltransferase, partial [Verrucomicrobiales bacterium]